MHTDVSTPAQLDRQSTSQFAELAAASCFSDTDPLRAIDAYVGAEVREFSAWLDAKAGRRDGSGATIAKLKRRAAHTQAQVNAYLTYWEGKEDSPLPRPWLGPAIRYSIGDWLIRRFDDVT